MFELLFGLERWLRRQKRRDRIELTFFNAAAEPGRRLGEGRSNRCSPRWAAGGSTHIWATSRFASPESGGTPMPVTSRLT